MIFLILRKKKRNVADGGINLLIYNTFQFSFFFLLCLMKLCYLISHLSHQIIVLCTYQCKSRGGGGGRGSAGKGREFDAWDYPHCRAFDRVKRPWGRDIWLWPTEAWYQFRSSYQVRPSRLPESHVVGERYEVFICFNCHNLIL